LAPCEKAAKTNTKSKPRRVGDYVNFASIFLVRKSQLIRPLACALPKDIVLTKKGPE
jgi:hypothetical protein